MCCAIALQNFSLVNVDQMEKHRALMDYLKIKNDLNLRGFVFGIFIVFACESNL